MYHSDREQRDREDILKSIAHTKRVPFSVVLSIYNTCKSYDKLIWAIETAAYTGGSPLDLLDVSWPKERECASF